MEPEEKDAALDDPRSRDRAAEGAHRRRLTVVLSWLFGLALVAVVVVAVRHYAEEREFAQLLERSQPGWLIAAALLQIGTYLSEACVWWIVLAKARLRSVPFRSLAALAFAKLFLDQAIPSGGVSGSLLVILGLRRRGIPREASFAAVLLDAGAYYTAYITGLALALAVAWWFGDLTALLMVPSGLFFLYAGAIVALLAHWSRGGQLGRAARLLPRAIREQLATAPPGIARDRRLFAQCFFFELAVFALDALTLWLLLFAVGSPLPFGRTLAAFMIATLARTMGLVPGGLGTFEIASVAALRLWGVPLVSALAATLLFRGYSFWLPMLPGLLLARRESRGAERPGR